MQLAEAVFKDLQTLIQCSAARVHPLKTATGHRRLQRLRVRSVESPIRRRCPLFSHLRLRFCEGARAPIRARRLKKNTQSGDTDGQRAEASRRDALDTTDADGANDADVA
eukprot:scaffold3340_cov255-Pinguiococcus_pyrenoidosus.AAC.6